MVKRSNEIDIRDKIRFPGLDIIRGFALINMVLYHLLYNMVYIFDFKISWFSIRQAYFWQQMICFTFIIVSGISFNLAKRPMKNAFILLICALNINAFTFMFASEHMIIFGIIHFFMAAMVLTFISKSLLKRIPYKIAVPVFIFLFILFKNLPNGYLSFFSIWQYKLPATLYQSTSLFFLGLPNESFRSADYFPIFPWWFLYLAGFCGYDYYKRSCQFLQNNYTFAKKKVYRLMEKTIGFLGRKSLIIYMLHQPVLYGILYWYVFSVDK